MYTRNRGTHAVATPPPPTSPLPRPEARNLAASRFDWHVIQEASTSTANARPPSSVQEEGENGVKTWSIVGEKAKGRAAPHARARAREQNAGVSKATKTTTPEAGVGCVGGGVSRQGSYNLHRQIRVLPVRRLDPAHGFPSPPPLLTASCPSRAGAGQTSRSHSAPSSSGACTRSRCARPGR